MFSTAIFVMSSTACKSSYARSRSLDDTNVVEVGGWWVARVARTFSLQRCKDSDRGLVAYPLLRVASFLSKARRLRTVVPMDDEQAARWIRAIADLWTSNGRRDVEWSKACRLRAVVPMDDDPGDLDVEHSSDGPRWRRRPDLLLAHAGAIQ
ncbi:hypothetical protein BJ912DRAFT_1067227 [Pholiota molesta]|nr:hypothetical protein BJ912DRAFT_1067227 [Pholiota molesta]